MQTILSTGTSSSSHTYGNVSSAVKEIIKSTFPENFFKYTHISTEILSKEMKEDRINTDTEFYKKTKPILTINPSFSSVAEEDKFLGGSLLVSGNNKFNSTISKLILMNLFNDTDNDLQLSYVMNRDRLIFEINIFVDTLFSQLDVYKNMQNQMNLDSPMFVNTSLESMIPRSMIEYIGKMNNIDINDEKQSGLILEYLNRHASYPITYKMRNSSSRDEFFMYFNISLLITFSELEISDSNKKGLVDDSFTITFKTTVDFNLPGAYYLIGDRSKPDGLSLDLVVGDSYQKDFIPIFTIYNLFDNIKSSKENFKLYSTCLFKTEDENNGDKDELPLDALFKSKEIIEVIQYHIANSIPIECFLEVCLIKDREKCEYGKEWLINWNTLTLTILESDNSSTYRIILFVDNLYLNNKIIDFLEVNNYDRGLVSKNINRID